MSSIAAKETGILNHYEHLVNGEETFGESFSCCCLVAFLLAGCAIGRMTVPKEKMRRRLSVKVGILESSIA